MSSSNSPPNDEFYLLVGKLSIFWGMIESLYTVWITHEISKDNFEVMLIVGRMEARLKLGKLKDIYRFRGDTRRLDFVKRVEVNTKHLQNYRNHLTHKFYTGQNAKGEFEFVDFQKAQKTRTGQNFNKFKTTTTELSEKTAQIGLWAKTIKEWLEKEQLL